MNKTDVLTGRIMQRVIDARIKEKNTNVTVKHGVSDNYNIDQLIHNLFELFPNSAVTLVRLRFGYELSIEVDKM